MTDQLSLRLDPDLPTLPNLPVTLRPMLARPLPEAFDSAEHLFEPSWAGTRVLAFVGPSERPGDGPVRILDEDGRDLSLALVELAGLGVRVDARSAVLDGELVVVDAAGRADAPELARRLDGQPGRRVAFLVFDLLHLDGRSLLGVPLFRRRQLLRRVLRPGDEVVPVPAIPGEGHALLAAVTEQGIAGVMARERTSPYLPGMRSRLWRFIPAGPAPVTGAQGGEARAGPERRPTDASEPASDPDGGSGPGPTSAPILALFSRLPLPEAEEE
jgi:bifunctional non-homologous end joining protein LigD